ncbi:MAG: hypothetical protein DRH26_01045 [Deltaproteobacteria bacterium]|nr:MAG: hypothetical protein DRH26_01045 [Deltaproteobacteria bacterium]
MSNIIIEDNEITGVSITKGDINKLVKKKQVSDNKQIDDNVRVIAELAKAVNQLATKPNSQDITPVLDVLSATLESQKKIIDLLSSPRKEQQWVFSLVRNENGSIKSIKAKESAKK